jgi:hydrogenase maturation protease
MASRVLIAGLGSPHGDDQVGWRAIERLGDLGADAEAVALREPFALLDRLGRLGGFERLVVIDACESGSPPGLVRRFRWPLEGDSIPDSPRSSHGFGLASLLRLAESLGTLPPNVVIFAVEAERCRPGDDLSPTVLESLPTLVAVVRREVRGSQPPPCAANQETAP